MILCCFVAQSDESLQNFVADRAHNTGDEKALKQQEG